ncbi:MAG TPA: hypothetical protein VGB93_00645 [Methylovirgula sp.]
MTDREEANANSTRAPARGEANEKEDLPYRVTLWDEENIPVVKVLARATSIVLARAIYVAALTENPGRRITLNRGLETISDSLEL